MSIYLYVPVFVQHEIIRFKIRTEENGLISLIHSAHFTLSYHCPPNMEEGEAAKSVSSVLQSCSHEGLSEWGRDG